MTNSAPKVLIEKIVPAPPRMVFEAWLDPDALRHFMRGAPGARVTRAEADARVGGKFVIVMNIGGHDVHHHGEYREIERYTRMVFTWLSPHAGEGSRVTLNFAESPGGQTKLALEHVGLPDAETRAKHHAGWSLVLTELAGLERFAA